MRLRALYILLVLPLLISPPFPAYTQSADSEVYPGKEWARIDKPESAGYSTPRLQALRGWLQTLDTTGMLVVVGGKSLFEYGDLTHLSYLASARKSVLAMLYGKYVDNGTIKLGTTLRELAFNDVGGLQERELEATIDHLVTARSGVYHPASNPGDSTDSAPPRTSQQPGAYYLYNNWDFNAAGAVFEKLTGHDIYDALETDLAKPIGMQDFDRARQRKTGSTQRSQYLAYHMWLSTRDMARIGLLMLREGRWGERQLISRDWIRKITSLVTPLNEMNPPAMRSLGSGERWGYGYMWWVWDAPNSPGPFAGAYSAKGAGGQFITVLPRLDLVIAHKVDMGQPPGQGRTGRRLVNGPEYYTVLRMLLAARCPAGKCAAAQGS